MFKRLELMARLASGLVRGVSGLSFQTPKARSIADAFHEFTRRIRRAGLLFVGMFVSLIAFSLLIHPVGLLLWVVTVPLAGFSSLLSMLWPTKSRTLMRSVERPGLRQSVASTLTYLRRSRSGVPFRSLVAYDCVVGKLKQIEALAEARLNPVLLDDAKRLTGGHLPRLVDSFMTLPPAQRTNERADAFGEALKSIANELGELAERLSDAGIDSFETERRFIANRYSRHGLASI